MPEAGPVAGHVFYLCPNPVPSCGSWDRASCRPGTLAAHDKAHKMAAGPRQGGCRRPQAPGHVTGTTFLQATALALIPSLVWGWLFVSRNPESRRLVVVTFLLGTLAVVPVLLFMAGLGIQLQRHEAAASQLSGQAAGQQVLGVLAFLASVTLVVFGVVRLFHFISRRIQRHSLRIGALLVVVLLLVVATLSYDQLRTFLGPFGGPLADLFHFLVIFSLVLFLLERVWSRTAFNVAAAALAALFILVVLNLDERLAMGDEVELTSISTIFSLPFLLDIVERGPLTLKILNFMQVYLTFALIAIATLLVIALVHMIYLLHERPWIKVVHGASLAFFSAPFLVWAISTVNPDAPLAMAALQVPAGVQGAWYANVVVLAALSLWSVIQFIRQSGAAAANLFTGLYEEPLNFLGVGLFLTLFVGIFHWFGLSVLAFSVIFLAFAEEYSKHLVVRFTDDDSIRSIDDAIEFSVIVGLAFAFAENVLLYFPRLLTEGNTAMLALRSVLTVLMHAVASGIFGYFYGLAHFSHEEVRLGHGGRGPLYRALHRVFLLRQESLYHEAKMFEGLVLAGTYHATFNLAASQGRVGAMIVLVGAGGAFLYYLLGLKSNRERLGEISAERVHDTYVGRLEGDRVPRGS